MNGLPAPAARPRRRVAVVVQRHGPGVLGGAEAHAAALVAALAPHHDVTVLTSCAQDAATWAMHFAPGDSVEQMVTVRRFAHPPRNDGARARVPLVHKLRWWLRGVFDGLGVVRVALPRGDPVYDGREFLRRQGPACDGLIAALSGGASTFDAVVFMTVLYHPTAEGLPVWGTRSVLIPTLHDERPMYLPWFHRVFAATGQTLWNTAAEQRLARRLYGASAQTGTVVGAAVRVRAPGPGEVEAVRSRHGLPARYLVYVGRIERAKGCAELLAAWQAIAGQTGDAALVFVGQGSMVVAASPRVRLTGFLGGAERDALVAGAAALVMPSRRESLSLVLLEALALGVPVLANARCEPLADHLRLSGAGEAYRGARALRAGLLRALARDAAERASLGAAGQRYVQAHYAPSMVEAIWLDAVESASRGAP
jgi:glycosyltransferase involved in cell wall biosynthesis